MPSNSGHPLAAEIVAILTARRQTVAVAESLTGGLIAAAITEVPGASVVFRGGVVAYATETKHTLLDVDDQLLAEAGAVDARVATEMADGVRDRFTATFGLASTGVAGPDPQDGKPVGTVFVAVSGPAGSEVVAPRLAGDRADIRRAAVAQALELLRRTLVRAGSDS
ncbi:MAG TPA: CinA family protein [Actinomycetes bacterium]|jgi:PncC family amidohydrolase|nr:CinA family protein [Actinomycetes bacterium]